ncbi:MAG TPA: hypothetical protein VJA21_21495 [Verrucomicrobiae bacterium]
MRPNEKLMIYEKGGLCLIACLSLFWAVTLPARGANPVLTVAAVGSQGFDVRADGVLVAPIRLAANGAIVADQTSATSTSVRLSALRAKDSAAVTFAPDDFVSITIPPAGSAVWEPVVQFKLTIRGFDTNKWLALFSGGPAPFHFLVCPLPTAKVWHQRGWLNATPVDDPFPLLQDVHVGSPEISCLWNTNWSYICPVGGHSIPMIGLWDPEAGLYVGYDFQGARVADGSERYIATAYCWRQDGTTNFVTLAYPHGGLRFGQKVYPRGGEVLASWFHLEIDNNLPGTEDPNERFQARLFERYTNALPAVPAMNDMAWIPGSARRQTFPNPPGLTLYGTDNGSVFRPPSAVVLRGWTGHREMPIDTAVDNGNLTGVVGARAQADYLLTNFARVFTAGGDTCLYWTKPLAGAWYPEWGGTNVTSLHNSEGWYTARVLVELYRYDRQRGVQNPVYLQAIDRLFNWAKHFVWSRNEFDDVPSSPFAIGSTLCSAFLLDYYFTFKDDAVRAASAALALRLAGNVTWRYLQCWAMDSDRSDAAVDSAFIAEPNSGRDWAALGCANEVNWNIDALTQVYVHTGDPRMSYYLRGMLQRWPALYRPIYQPSIAQYGSDSLTEGYGIFDGAGPGRGGRYDYGFTEPLPFNEPIGASVLRIIAGARACIAFNKGGTGKDVADYRTDGNGNCSFRVVANTSPFFDATFSYPFVDISRLTVTRRRGTQFVTLGPSLLQHPSQSPSSLYFVQLMTGDVITIGNISTNSPVIVTPTPLVYDESAVQSVTNGLFVSLGLPGTSLLAQDWSDPNSFAGLVPGLRWVCGVPYQQRLKGATNLVPAAASGAYAVVVAYSPPTDQTLTAAPRVVLDDGTPLPLHGQPAPAWRAWPMLFNRRVLVDYALLPAGRSVQQVDPKGALVMDLTVFMGNQTTWQAFESTLTNAGAAFAIEEQQRQMLLALRASYAQLPSDKMALLPLSTSGAAANFAALTGLSLKWRSLTETQMVDAAYFTASRFPLAFYLGSENYVKTVITPGDGKTAISRYLAGGGTLVVLATGPFPFYYGYGPNDQPGAADPLLPALGLPIYNAFEQAPPSLSMVVSTNQSILHSVASIFPFPPGDPRLRPVKRSQVSPLNRYVPWLTVTNMAGTGYGDAGCWIVFGTGSASGGKILYLWSSLLSGPQGPALMADAVSWVIDATLRTPAPRFNYINRLPPNSLALNFSALPNLAYALQYTNTLTGSTGPWPLLQEFGSSPVDRSLSYTSSISAVQTRFFRIWARP